MVDCSILIRIFKKTNEELSEHFSSLGLDLILSNILFKWMLSLFTENCIENIMIKIWDCLFLDGDIVLFKACVGLLRVMTNDLLKTKQVENIMKICQSDDYFNSIEDLDVKMDYFLLIKKYSFDKDLISNNRELIFPKVKNTIKKLDKKQHKKLLQTEKCNLKWPFCLENIDRYFIKHYSVFKEMNEPNIIENYYFSDPNFTKKKFIRNYSKEDITSLDINNKNNEDIFEHLLMERKSHKCDDSKNVEIKIKQRFSFDVKSSNNLFFINPLEMIHEINFQRSNTGEIIDEISKEFDKEVEEKKEKERILKEKEKKEKDYEELFNEYDYNLDYY